LLPKIINIYIMVLAKTSWGQFGYQIKLNPHQESCLCKWRYSCTRVCSPWGSGTPSSSLPLQVPLLQENAH
jgi:hypothetical protein